MDYRRLSTADVLTSGILKVPEPKTDIPKDREEVSYSEVEPERWADVIESGKLLQCCEYYGIAYAWKESVTYRGILLQYRTVTEDKEFDSAESLARWFSSTVPLIEG